MARLAHISDIHFGPEFNVETWRNVRKHIEEFDPEILVVSGDLVDHPLPFRLLAVKSELEDLCTRCPSKPQLFVVPGNHDLCWWGNFRVRLWPRWLERRVLPIWFERIMFNDTANARRRLERDLHLKLGLNEDCRRLTFPRAFMRFKPDNAFRLNVSNARCDGRLQSCDRRKGGGVWPTESVHNQVAIACFDSNPFLGRRLAFATGQVEPNQDKIRSATQRAACFRMRTLCGMRFAGNWHA
jgi:hypothetical protein